MNELGMLPHYLFFGLLAYFIIRVGLALLKNSKNKMYLTLLDMAFSFYSLSLALIIIYKLDVFIEFDIYSFIYLTFVLFYAIYFICMAVSLIKLLKLGKK
ncbi:hypothetical protein [Bacillus horti]|uniref:Uncharacterized protein n=1 Tax=Caldalkalibacillus horti TaxID=77523 RepID=A0ABT9W436_9BACI|nr:hypothetical protein [Bacillus horti]MDQ0168006.1 hypothetical protein [Bacillus horti]